MFWCGKHIHGVLRFENTTEIEENISDNQEICNEIQLQETI